jgi:hypothetical protein
MVFWRKGIADVWFGDLIEVFFNHETHEPHENVFLRKEISDVLVV